jgi:hypothetical protein
MNLFKLYHDLWGPLEKLSDKDNEDLCITFFGRG